MKTMSLQYLELEKNLFGCSKLHPLKLEDTSVTLQNQTDSGVFAIIEPRMPKTSGRSYSPGEEEFVLEYSTPDDAKTVYDAIKSYPLWQSFED